MSPTDENEFRDLATYNAEVSRGIMHTPEWQARMAHEQKRFDWQTRREFIASHGGRVEHLGPPPPPVYVAAAHEKLGTELPVPHALLLAILGAGLGVAAALLLVLLA